MITEKQKNIAIAAGRMLAKGYHCSEAMVHAVGGFYFPELDQQFLKAASGFAGGVGRQHMDLCGALTGGIMVIGALYGRTAASVDDEKCQRVTSAFRNAFLQQHGSLNCCDLRDGDCGKLVESSARILFEVLNEQ